MARSDGEGGGGQMASKLMRTPVGPEPTIFGLVFRRLAHQAKEASNAIRPPKALNATSAVWVSGVGPVGSSKASDTPTPWEGGGGRGEGHGLRRRELSPGLSRDRRKY